MQTANGPDDCHLDLDSGRHLDARSAADPHPRRAQGLRPDHRPRWHRVRRDEGRGDLPHRPVRCREIDAAALRQRAGADRPRLDPGREPGGERSKARQARAASQGRHGVSAIQPLPAPHRAGKHHDGADPRAQARSARGRGAGARADAQGAPRGQGEVLSGRAFRRPAAARRHRPQPRDAARRDAVRRGDRRARSRRPGGRKCSSPSANSSRKA